jgi:SAM-dependent methyltransferase
MLAQARARARSLPPGTGGASFYAALGDAAALPVASGAFDVVTCGNAVHHFASVEPVLRELRRACKPGGVMAISDLASDEDPAKPAEHNAIERLRDPSHVRSLPVSELVALLERHGCAVRGVTTTATRRGLGEWLAIAHTPPEAAAEVRRRLEATIAGNGAGLDVAWEDGPEGRELRFTHTTAWVVAGTESRERSA